MRANESLEKLFDYTRKKIVSQLLKVNNKYSSYKVLKYKSKR